MPYVSATTIKPLLCAAPEAISQTEAEFDTTLTTLIRWATAEINTYLQRTYTTEELAANEVLASALESVSFQAVDNYLITVIQRKNNLIVTINDFAVSNPPRIILTQEMKETLDPYKSTT